MSTNLTYPYTFEGGEKAVASEVNANFDVIKIFANAINSEIQSIQTAIGKLEEKPTREMLDVYFSFSAESPTGAYPLWTGETITNCKLIYPDFWKEINRLADAQNIPTVTSEEYEEKIEEFGQCASFYIDTLNGHVRLPKITRFISSISDLTEIAKIENDANKAHIHNINVSSDGSKAGTDTKTGYLARGFTKYSSPWSVNHNNGENEVLVTSEGEEEGHPKNVRLCLYLQVANNTAEISRLDVDVIVEQMNTALEELEKAYNEYSASLEAEFGKIKEQVLNASPVTKVEDTTVSSSLWLEITAPNNEYKEAGYLYSAAIPVDEAEETLAPTVVFSVKDATSGNFAPTADADDGHVFIYAKEKPAEDILIKTIILQ